MSISIVKINYIRICLFSFFIQKKKKSWLYLILAWTVSESKRFIGNGVIDPDAMQLVPGRDILMLPFP